MRQKHRLLSALLTAVLTVPMLVLGPATPVQADPIPTTNYSPVDISDISANGGAVHLRSHVDGGATVARTCSTAVSDYAFKAFANDGTVVQSELNYSSGDPNYYPHYCGGGGVWAVGSDGTEYFYATVADDQPGIVAFADDQLLWSYTPNCGKYWYVDAMSVGVDGNVYVTASGGNSNPGCSSTRVVGLTPTAQNGAPQVVLNVSVGAWMTQGGAMAAYEDGLVLHKRGDRIQYVDYDGTVGQTFQYEAGSVGFGYREEFQAAPSGRVFIPEEANSGTTTGCDWPSSVAGSISAVEPTGVAWTVQLPACSYVGAMWPTPDGGVVAHIDHGAPTTEEDVTVVAYDADGDHQWTRSYGTAGSSSEFYINDLDLAVDLNGNVAVQRNLVVKEQIGGSTYRFGEVRFELVSGVTGHVLPGTQFTLRGDHSTTSGPSYKWVEGLVRIAEGTAYVAAKECTTWNNNCDPDSVKLYPFTVPGLQMDYPRGAILRYDEPWLNYVAMGDSFSSGEGVEPFIAGTDTAGPPPNGCHRSEGAYPELLGGNPALRWQEPLFVACSGAKTEHITTVQRFDEGPQINSLGQNVDVVTLTIGGNDIEFVPFAEACVTPLSDCTDGEDDDTLWLIENVLPDKLDDAYQAIASEINTSTAQVLVIGYPMLVSEPQSTSLIDGR